MKAPFPYFGGKSAVASIVWRALGQPSHYLEPFFGSGAVLLNRPDFDVTSHTETICDSDGHVCNVWRALHADPEAVAKVCDWPVNHADLIARKAVLNRETESLLENLCRDDAYYNVKLAGYWIWAASCWIGSGLIRPKQIPHISNAGMGVHARGQIPHISGGGKGVQEPFNANLYEWFRSLSERLRYVRVICGDWKRICGGDWQNKLGPCGIFFDPPYSDVADQDSRIYSTDSLQVAHDVRDWCLDRGQRKDHRIVLAGYYEEHESLLTEGWTAHSWSARGGYSFTARNGQTNAQLNRHKETLFFSPHCIQGAREAMLFPDDEPVLIEEAL